MCFPTTGFPTILKKMNIKLLIVNCSVRKVIIYLCITECNIFALMPIPVYNTCTLLQNKEKYVDANLDAPYNTISDNESSSEMLTSKSQIPE